MNYEKLAQLLIRDEDVKPLEYYEAQYPERGLEKGAEVTRLAPSPTGFMHIGNLYVALANERIAHQSGGVFYLRIEDTDEKRKVEGAVEVIQSSLKYFGVEFDEGADMGGAYGPYYQRQRAEIYHAFAVGFSAGGHLVADLANEYMLVEENTASPWIVGRRR